MFYKKVLLSLSVAIPLVASFPGFSAEDAETVPAISLEEQAWQIFVRINSKNPAGQLEWETWLTQACLNNPGDCPGASARLHASELRSATHRDDPARTGGCSAMTTTDSAPADLKPFVPANLSDNPVFCEEVTIDPIEQEYTESRGLLSVAGQMKYLKAGGTIDVDWGALEVKADWVPSSSYTNVTFECDGSSTQIYTEEIDGVCYGLVGIHISSKTFPNWLWATFEPQFDKTNPNRCDPNLYNACSDSWGSSPAISTGADTSATSALTALFDSAGAELDAAFRNYRLTGVQVEFDQPVHSEGRLGSSFVEFNAQVPVHEASCITCHSYAQRSVDTGKTPPGGAPAGYPSVGTPKPLSSDFKSLDFSWFLGFGVPQNPTASKVDE